MKKKILIALLLLIPFISIICVILFRGVLMPSNEEILLSLRDVQCYKSEVEYIIKNDKGIERDETKQSYSKDDGVRVEYGDELVKIFKEDGIHVTDNKNNSTYILDSYMDVLYSLGFMNNILSYSIDESSITEGQEEWGDIKYIQADLELYLNNIYFDKARIYVDKDQQVPIGIIIYDKNGNDTLRIIYRNFKKMKNINIEEAICSNIIFIFNDKK